MGISKIKTLLSSFCLVVCMIIAPLKDVQAEDCDPFALDPFDASACGGGDPDNAPLDEGVVILVIAGVLIGCYKLSGFKHSHSNS